MNKNYLTTTELSKLLGVSRVAVFKKIKSGKIKARKDGRNYLVDKRELGSVVNGSLSKNEKREINNSIKKTIREYGETLKLLGRE